MSFSIFHNDMLNITLMSCTNNDVIIINRNNELCGLLILTRQFSESGFGIRATYEIDNYQIMVEESIHQINIDISYIQTEDNEYISDEDFTEFEQTNNTNFNLDNEIPISWYNRFDRLNINETDDWEDQSPSPGSI